MSDAPNLIIAEAMTFNEKLQNTNTQHWVSIAKHVVSNPERLDYIIIPNLTGRTKKMNEWVEEWIKPRLESRESVNPTDTVGNLNYLARVVYSEMYQISVPGEESNIGVMSLGGVISHVTFDNNLYRKLNGKIIRNKDESFQFFGLKCKKTVDEEIGNILTEKISEESATKIFQALGINETKPETIESMFKITWDHLSKEEPTIHLISDENMLRSYVNKLVEIRSIPEFQFIFSSPIWYEAVEITIKSQEIKE